MTNAHFRKLHEVPEPENYDEKEVYAFFGLCAFCAQCLERGLVNLAVILHARGFSVITREAVEAAFDNMGNHTLGKLINNVKQKINVPDGIEDALAKALDDRNYLMHHFFVKHDINFSSNVGRKIMVAELRTMIMHFQRTDRLVEEITLPLWEKIGVTEQLLEQELRKMDDEAKALDSSTRYKK